MKRCPVCGETNMERNRFCGNCGAELGTGAGGASGDLARGAEQLLYDLVKGVSRTFFELREHLESTRWAEQGKGSVDQAVGRLKDAIEAGRREYEDRKTGPTETEGRYEIPLAGATGGATADTAATPPAPASETGPTAPASPATGWGTASADPVTSPTGRVPIGDVSAPTPFGSPAPAAPTTPPSPPPGERERPS